MFNFGFLEKGLTIVSLPHFVFDFSRKAFLMLHYILLADQTLFSDCFYVFEMLGNKRGFLFKIGPWEPNLGSGEYKKAEYLGGFQKGNWRC